MKAFKLILILLYLAVWTSPSAGSLFTSPKVTAIKLVSGSKSDTAMINSIARNGFKYLSKPVMLEKSKALIDSAELICDKKNIEITPLLHLLKANYSLWTEDYTSAAEEAQKAMKKAESSGEKFILAKTMIFMGNYYFQMGLFPEGMNYFEKSIELSKREKLRGIIPTSYDGESKIYRKVGDLKGYRQSLQMMIDAAFAENDTSHLEAGFSRLGTSFTDEKDRYFRQADSLLRRSLEISLIKKDTGVTAFSLANIGWNFYLEKMYDSSLYNYNRSLKYSIPANLNSASANSLGNIGTIYRDLGKPEAAISFYEKGIEQAKEVNDWYDLYWIYMDMSKLYLSIKDTSNAYKSYVLYKKFWDAYISKENTQGLTDTRLRYEFENHNKEVELLSLRLKNQRILNYGFSGFIVLGLAIGLLLFRGSKLKAKRRISEMNHKISEITQANLRQQMNPHFIFNTLNSIQYYMYQHDKLATNNYLTKFSNLMRKILDNSQHTSIPLNDEITALNLYLELESIRFKDKFDYEIKVDEEIDPLLYKIPTMLIQPYVENSICHGLMPREGKGSVRIDIKLEKDFLLCTIEDNGIGRNAARERNLKRETNHNSLGTQITTSRLDLVNALYGTSLKTVYTDLKNENGESAGTRVEIHIPIMT
ncbi:MAG TPA: histidine kinase [Bacteroidales bacterium]|nr:histidine kinase [Bacteroidales bacterium]